MDVESVSRRNLLAITGAGVVALGLAGCGSGGGNKSLTQSLGPVSNVKAAPPGPGNVSHGRKGGSVVTAWPQEANSYDAALGYDLHSWDAVCCLLYTPLYLFDGKTGGPAPAAALAMPKVSADGKNYVIQLRPDFKFHNGRRIVAADYVYALTRVLDPSLESWASSYLLGIKGAKAFYAGKSKDVSGLIARDDYTLEINLEDRDVTFASVLCQPYTSALPAEEVKKLGKAFSRTPVGNGPFQIVSYDSKARTAVFKASPNFPWAGLPFLDKVEYRWGIDASLQFLQLQKGDVDILGEGLTPSMAARVQSNRGLRTKYAVTIPLLGLSWASINVSSPKLKDLRVRQALNWATDRDQLARQSHGLQSPWGSCLPKEQAEYKRTAKPYTLDVKRAKALLAEAGVGSLTLEFICPDEGYWKSASQILQQQWSKIGVNLKITTLNGSAFWDAAEKSKGDLFGQHWYQVQPSGLDIISTNFVTNAASNYSGYSNPKVDALVARATATRTLAESNKILAGAEELISEDAPGVFIGGLNFTAMRAPRVRNYQYRGETGTYYNRLWV